MQKNLKPYRIAVDVGGTFTDVAIHNSHTDELSVVKVPSTPHDPMIAVMDGLTQSDIELREVEMLSHGTTVATNALIQRAFPPSAMITRRASGTFSKSEMARRTSCGTRTRMSGIPTFDAATATKFPGESTTTALSCLPWMKKKLDASRRFCERKALKLSRSASSIHTPMPSMKRRWQRS